MINYHRPPKHEAAYLEERKNKCEHCHPKHEVTQKWLENVSNQDILFKVHQQYGITPATVYHEFEAEITIRLEESIVPEPREEVA
ncbi:MAG TPA: hypothetical protein VM101_04275 [Flavitalea sp.]|nr:hypothetical protein [Flavitalea sp.]